MLVYDNIQEEAKNKPKPVTIKSTDLDSKKQEGEAENPESDCIFSRAAKRK
jgi:hypothetical protein